MHLTQNWQLRKPGVASKGGIVAAQSVAAAAVGADILSAGGTAVDAAVGTALAGAAAEPWSSGLGGIGHLIVHRAGDRHAEAVDFGPISPPGLDPAAYPVSDAIRSDLFTWPQSVVGDRNIHGPLAFTIPSAVRGYAVAVERHGRMPWRELVAPAAALARRGLPIDWFTTLKVANAAANLRRYEESRRVWLPDGLPPVSSADGDVRYLPLGRLAATFERLAEAGAQDFYHGDIAQSIAADARAGEGFLCLDDLANCEVRVRPALQIPYHGVTVQATLGLTAGPTLAAVLKELDERRFGTAADADYFAAVIAALHRAYADRLEHAGDVESGLATSTTHITAIDREGTIASLTTTLLSLFGSHYVLPGTGILMNNGILWFDPRPGRPNSIAPGKRALTNMCPVVVTRDGRPWFGLGASGGRHILAAVLQMIGFIVDFGMDAEVAAHHPRIDVSGSDRTEIDRRLPPGIAETLLQSGASLVEHGVYPARFACPNLVLCGADGLNHGISDVMSPWSGTAAEPDFSA
jgi:gamma-glutamyltranspeptidase / glutathione hydrolase